ncbi:hypothetical protein FraEuI1c_3955 [Pseudofrankia inefficax]|uniref:Uncharacterized protein n=1 Tax=Pseudofrankia inefficax (strain DSM 45817 / CECT 9037 / DDB 130130 / EuI1c) TaxID=298654 RepID=E3J6N7_PSEI1|nr:hypothetical protein FraEuI1c_3955 [Pseudofrankia inefficax]
MFIVGDRVFTVRECRVDAPRSLVVTVTMDGGFEWSFEESGWRPLSFGAVDGALWVWSARGLLAFPGSGIGRPDVIRVDEDLLYSFRCDAGWLLVCETSVRRHVGGSETDRFDLGEVVERARWDGGRLWLLDAAGREYRLQVAGTRLTT